MNRRQLEREADRLGIPWTQETSDQDLQTLVQRSSDNGLPDYAGNPPCFGILWQGDHDEEYCRGCAIKGKCLDLFATEHIPRVREVLGPQATLKVIAERTKVMPEAILEALKYAKVQREASGDAKAVTPEDVTIEATEKIENIKKETKAMSRKKKKAGAKKKATKRKAKPRRVDRPRKAGPVQRASGPVMAKLSLASVKHATALASQTRNWGDNEKRWQRERDRVPAIAALIQGSVIRREYKGKIFEVKVLDGRYKIIQTGEEYPTLYAVTKAITGLHARQSQRKKPGNEESRPEGHRKLSNWSATKFFAIALREALYGKQKELPRKHPPKAKVKRKQRMKTKAKKK